MVDEAKKRLYKEVDDLKRIDILKPKLEKVKNIFKNLKEIKEIKEIKEEIKHFQETGIPRCMYCKKNFVNDIDSITKKKSKYLWKPICKCSKSKLRLSIG